MMKVTGGFPTGHGMDNAQGFGIHERVQAAENHRGTDFSFLINKELDEHPSCDAVRQKFLGITGILYHILDKRFCTSGELWHWYTIYKNIFLLIGRCTV